MFRASSVASLTASLLAASLLAGNSLLGQPVSLPSVDCAGCQNLTMDGPPVGPTGVCGLMLKIIVLYKNGSCIEHITSQGTFCDNGPPCKPEFYFQYQSMCDDNDLDVDHGGTSWFDVPGLPSTVVPPATTPVWKTAARRSDNQTCGSPEISISATLTNSYSIVVNGETVVITESVSTTATTECTECP